MRIRWERCSRIPRWDRPVPWVLAAWAGLVLASMLAEGWAGGAFGTCLLRRWTGHPCPTCGSTRAVQALLQGDPAAALVRNPLVAAGLPVLLGLATLRIAAGRCLRLEVGGAGQRLLTLAFLLAVAANWAWVLRHP